MRRGDLRESDTARSRRGNRYTGTLLKKGNHCISADFRSLRACRPRTQAPRKDEFCDALVSARDTNGTAKTDGFLLLQRRDRLLCDLPPIANHFTPDFLNLFQFSYRTDGRIRAVTRPELSLSRRDEATFAVIWKCAGTSGKNCRLDLRKTLRRTEEYEFVAHDFGNRSGGHLGRMC